VTRNDVIVAAIQSGERAPALAREHGISRERVRQIYKRQTGSNLPAYSRPCPICKLPYTRQMAKFHPLDPVHREARAKRSEERFWAFVDRSDPFSCWPWKGAMYPTGYGSTHRGKES
jgi:hypothetical protein